MHLQSRPVPSLGLLHVLEDTLSILEGEKLEADRRAYVLKRSKTFLATAKRGYSISRQKSLFVERSKWPALESFNLLKTYLSVPATAAPLKEVSDVLVRVGANKSVPKRERETAIKALRELCTSMARDISPRSQGGAQLGPRI